MIYIYIYIHEHKNLIKKMLLNTKLKDVFKQDNIKFINIEYMEKTQKIYNFEIFNNKI